MVNAGVWDGSALLAMLMSHKCKAFDNYAEKVFLPHMLEKLESVGRLDILWNPYLPQSLKQATRSKRGSSCRVSVKECTATPSSSETFLKLEQNKAKLSHFLAENIGSVAAEGKQLCTALENNSVYAAHINNVHDIAPSNHEEADTRIILHTFHCAKQGYDTVIIKIC